MIEKVQDAITGRPELEGGMLLLDESADEKSGCHAAGAGRQHNGRMGKVDESQVGVYLAYAQQQHWMIWDAALFIPESWFAPNQARQRQKAEIPAERVFQTKIELGWDMIARAHAQGLAFVAVAFDSLYGRSHWLRQQCDQAQLEYYADIPNNYPLYPTRPEVEFEQGRRGKPTQTFRVVGAAALPATELAQSSSLQWVSLTLRTTERGWLVAEFARQSIWTVDRQGRVRQETLLLKREPKGIRYVLTNAPVTGDFLTQAYRKCQRYFVERSLQDAKSELGLAEFQALKYRAWQHHLALTIVASWFIAETRLDWQHQLPRDPTLTHEYATDVLPQLSMANVRELLRATLPLRQLSPLEAASLVVQHLDRRTRSRRSRLKKRLKT